jgi:cytoplasmic tRNA 2-thiolation protein 2
VEQYKNFEFVVLNLEDAFDAEWWSLPPAAANQTMDITGDDITLSTSESPATPISRLKAHISSLPSASSIPNAIDNISRILLLNAAARHSCSHLLLGTSMTSSGIGLISGIAGGSGVNGFEKGGELWMPNPNVLSSPVHFSRPLAEIGMKECTAWVHWHGLDIVAKDELPLQRVQKPGASSKTLAISSLTQGVIFPDLSEALSHLSVIQISFLV